MKKNNSKLKYIYIILALVILVLVSLSVFLSSSKELTMEEEYKNLTKNHVYEKINLDEYFIKLENDETFIVYVGFKECEYCQNLIEKANQIFKEYDVEKVYYSDYSIKENKEYFKNQEFEYLGTPVFFYFIDGEYVFSSQGKYYDENEQLEVGLEESLVDYLMLKEK